MSKPVQPEPSRRKPTAAWKVVAALGLAFFAFCAAQVWPFAYFPESVCLTGQDVSLQQIWYARDPGREGYSASIQLISPADCKRLQDARANLATYPMWSPGAAIERYYQVTWKSLDELGKQELPKYVSRALNHEPHEMDPADVKTINEAKQFAAFLSRQQGALIAGRYDDRVANYTVYVLDLERGILVMINLLT